VGSGANDTRGGVGVGTFRAVELRARR
jgi:hypothetical protein